MKPFYVYILSSGKNGTLYTGVTNDLLRRVSEHKEGRVEGFSKKHNVNHLVYYVETPDAISAIASEKAIKKWKREWKIRLIEEHNPSWTDLYNDIIVSQ